MTIEVTAKKVEEAIANGLKQLGASLDEVNVEVLESGGLFRKAKVRLTLETPEQEPVPTETPAVKPQTKAEKPAEPVKPQTKAEKPAVKPQTKAEKPAENTKPKTKTAKTGKPAEKPVQKQKPAVEEKRELTPEDIAAAARAFEFVKEIIAKMGFDGVTAAADERGEVITVTAPEGDDSILIGRHGETLSALSYLAETYARAEKCRVNITVDCNGYRARRASSLTAMARRRADECVAKHRKIKLEPMERIDRRTVHNALTFDARVRTVSEGKEPHRYIVILPADKKQSN